MVEAAADPPQPGLDGAMDALATAMQQVEDAANFYKDTAENKDKRIAELEELLRESANALHTKEAEISKQQKTVGKRNEKIKSLEIELSATKAELKDHEDRHTQLKSLFQ